MQIRFPTNRRVSAMHSWHSAACAALFLALLPCAAAAYSPIAEIIPIDGAASDEFGTSIAISGDTAVFGAPGDDAGIGSAYVFRYDEVEGWVEEQTLTATGGAAGDRFGNSVGISGDTIVVGAEMDDDDDNGAQAGAAYVFRFNGETWAQEARLTASDGAADDNFGHVVGVSGNSIVVGAYLADLDSVIDAGAAYAFQRSGTIWSPKGKLIEPDARASNQFGSSVAISGDTIAVGSPYQYDAGRVYAFRYNEGSWSQEFMFANAGGQFGSSVSLSGDVLAIGAMNADGEGNGLEAGTAFVYRRRGGVSWVGEARLSASNGRANDHFGTSVTVSDDTLLVSAPGHETPFGVAYMFWYDGSSWGEREVDTLDEPDGHFLNRYVGFGAAIALSGDLALVGSPYSDVNGTDSGKAHYFKLGPRPIARLIGSDSTSYDRFGGDAVAISGDTALVGAPRDDDSGAGPMNGAAYVFGYGDVRGWIEEDKLTASDGQEDDGFGKYIAISGDRAVFAAPGASGNIGAAYVFARAGGIWSEEGKLTPSGGLADDGFADEPSAIAISGDRVVIGAQYNGNRGAAYVFRYDDILEDWVQEKKLTASDGSSGDYFGVSVAISADIIVVGAPYAGSSGAAYVFRYDDQLEDWVEDDAKLIATADGDFGFSMAMSSDTLVISAPFDGDAGQGTDAVYVFHYNGPSWVEQTELIQPTGRQPYTVAISGGTILISFYEGISVYQYDDILEDWIENPDLIYPGRIGNCSISGDTLLVGAQAQSNINGVAYVYSTLPVPEPSLLALNLAALLALACVARRRA